jgi:hypothetical protein
MVRKKFSKKEIFIGIACTLFALLMLSLYVWHQTESVSLGYDSAELRDKLKLSEPEEEQIVYEDIEKER